MVPCRRGLGIRIEVKAAPPIIAPERRVALPQIHAVGDPLTNRSGSLSHWPLQPINSLAVCLAAIVS